VLNSLSSLAEYVVNVGAVNVMFEQV